MNHSVGMIFDTSEFNSAIDNILELFDGGGCWEDNDENNDNDKLLRTKPKGNSQQHSVERKHIDTRKNTPRNAPRVMKNDIRRYFSKMLMNTVNSGDIGLLQDYFNTFMMGPSKFVVDYTNIDPIFQLPGTINSYGPQLMSHYMLGCFVMYPDIVLQMTDTRIITSNSWAGSKVEMDIDVLATKMYDISMDDWIPQCATLQNIYQTLVAEKQQKRKEKSTAAATTISTVTAIPTATRPRDTSTVDIMRSWVETTYGENASNSISYSDSPRDQSTASTGAGNGIVNKRKASDLNHQLNSSESRDGNIANHTLGLPESRIPDEYIHSLAAQAELLSAPLQLHMSGKFTMFLDENKRIQHINFFFTQSD